MLVQAEIGLEEQARATAELARSRSSGRPLVLRGGLDSDTSQERERVPMYAKGPVLAG